MELKVRISQHTHLWDVEPFDLRLPADPDRRDQVTNFEPHVCHHKAEHHDHDSTEQLHEELRGVAVEQPTNTVRPVCLHESFTHHTVPARAILPGREDPDRQHTPDAVDTVYGDRPDRIIDAA